MTTKASRRTKLTMIGVVSALVLAVVIGRVTGKLRTLDVRCGIPSALPEAV